MPDRLKSTGMLDFLGDDFNDVSCAALSLVRIGYTHMRQSTWLMEGFSRAPGIWQTLVLCLLRPRYT